LSINYTNFTAIQKLTVPAGRAVHFPVFGGEKSGVLLIQRGEVALTAKSELLGYLRDAHSAVG
jgi:hypothetical protein